MLNSVRAALILARRGERLNQTEVGKACDISQSQQSDREGGSPVTLKQVERWARAVHRRFFGAVVTEEEYLLLDAMRRALPHIPPQHRKAFLLDFDRYARKADTQEALGTRSA